MTLVFSFTVPASFLLTLSYDSNFDKGPVFSFINPFNVSKLLTSLLVASFILSCALLALFIIPLSPKIAFMLTHANINNTTI
ncbi:MAG: hypothetical protein ACM67R_02295, partial [Clostridiales bacterium]